MKVRKVLIVGGDKVAYHLIAMLLKEKLYEIHVIDTRISVCEKIANDYDVKVYHGDGTNVEVLERANAKNADVLIALTGEDESNLVACQIAKLKFNVDLTIAKVNNPKNTYLLQMFGVDRSFSITETIAQMIDQEVAYSGMSLVYSFPGNTKSIIEVPLSPQSEATGKTLIEYDFVGDSRVVLITRNSGDSVIATGDTRMLIGDTLLMVCDQKDFEEIWMTLVNPNYESAEAVEN